jgi:hypothetical protein
MTPNQKRRAAITAIRGAQKAIIRAAAAWQQEGWNTFRLARPTLRIQEALSILESLGRRNGKETRLNKGAKGAGNAMKNGGDKLRDAGDRL